MRRYVWIGITVVGVILIGLALRPQAMPMDLGYPERQAIWNRSPRKRIRGGAVVRGGHAGRRHAGAYRAGGR